MCYGSTITTFANDLKSKCLDHLAQFVCFLFRPSQDPNDKDGQTQSVYKIFHQNGHRVSEANPFCFILRFLIEQLDFGILFYADK